MEVGSLCCHNSFDAENGGFIGGRITEYVPIIRMCEVNNLDGFTASFFGHALHSIGEICQRSEVELVINQMRENKVLRTLN